MQWETHEMQNFLQHLTTKSSGEMPPSPVLHSLALLTGIKTFDELVITMRRQDGTVTWEAVGVKGTAAVHVRAVAKPDAGAWDWDAEQHRQAPSDLSLTTRAFRVDEVTEVQVGEIKSWGKNDHVPGLGNGYGVWSLKLRDGSTIDIPGTRNGEDEALAQHFLRSIGFKDTAPEESA